MTKQTTVVVTGSLRVKDAGCIANSVDLHKMPYLAASDLGLYGLVRPVSYNIWGIV